jgi:hypothetical protein
MAGYIRKQGYFLIAVIVLCYCITPTLARSYTQYERFFPAWEHLIQVQLRDNCTQQLNDYRNRSNTDQGAGYSVLGCILETMPEYRKAELASAAVILGFAPTALQLISASYLDTAMLAYRRPGLAFLLSISSSGVRPLTATDYDDFIDTMGTDPFHAFPFHTDFSKPQSVWLPTLISILEYTIAGGAIANNVYLTYQLSVWAVCTFSPQQEFLPAIWTAAALVLHLFGYLAARLKVSVNIEDNDRYTLRRRLWVEFLPTPWQTKLRVKKNDRHNGWFLVLVSALYIGDALQAFFGTLVLSSLVFISVKDSAVIVMRLMASALFARGVLLYELAGYRTENNSFSLFKKASYSAVGI